ncbi:hypothetical protein AB0395_48295 [Streptosporangium sp. NPDC051023]|uniref:hypothetical protein n=1 Tax=Streptosporangium sp. NPDC051023 TaxID=3155410 RepID=UPI00344B1DFE
MNNTDLRKIAGLVNTEVRVTAVFTIRGCPSEPKVYEGLLMAIGQKQGPRDRNTKPWCLVLNAIDHTGGVPIIAIRSVVSVEPLKS